MEIHGRPHPTGYTFQTGTYPIGENTVTIDEEGNRITPSVNEPDCTIAVIGDSVTFGIGVSDEYTYPYLLGEEYPNLQFINTGKPGYNSTNLSRMVEYTTADAYIYMIVINDIQSPIEYTGEISISFAAITTHLRYLQSISRTPVQQPNLYTESLNVITDANVIIFSAGEHDAHAHAERFLGESIEIIPRDTRVSFADGHPNEEGHQAIADVIAPHVESIHTNDCNFSTMN